MTTHEPAKRAAYEPVERLLRPTRYDPGMKRPVATVAGAILVLLRVAAGVWWVADVGAHWAEYAGKAEVAVGDIPLSSEAIRDSFAVFAVVAGAVLLVETVLGLLILRGVNWPRVLVMVFAVVSVSSSFVGWWAQGQDITLSTTLLSVALDILVLLALSSRGAAAYARRAERR